MLYLAICQSKGIIRDTGKLNHIVPPIDRLSDTFTGVSISLWCSRQVPLYFPSRIQSQSQLLSQNGPFDDLRCDLQLIEKMFIRLG